MAPAQTNGWEVGEQPGVGWLHTTASLGPWKGWQAGVMMFSPGFPCRKRNGSRDRAGEDVNISQVPCLAGMRGGVKPEARSEHQFLQEPTMTGEKNVFEAWTYFLFCNSLSAER